MNRPKKEKWLIEYSMIKNGTEVHLREHLECTFGYHFRYRNFCYRNPIHPDDPSEETPLYKVRSGNYIELLLGDGMVLPLEKKVELENAELLADKNHPITLIAPNGTKYIKKIF